MHTIESSLQSGAHGWLQEEEAGKKGAVRAKRKSVAASRKPKAKKKTA